MILHYNLMQCNTPYCDPIWYTKYTVNVILLCIWVVINFLPLFVKKKKKQQVYWEIKMILVFVDFLKKLGAELM